MTIIYSTTLQFNESIKTANERILFSYAKQLTDLGNLNYRIIANQTNINKQLVQSLFKSGQIKEWLETTSDNQIDKVIPVEFKLLTETGLNQTSLITYSLIIHLINQSPDKTLSISNKVLAKQLNLSQKRVEYILCKLYKDTKLKRLHQTFSLNYKTI